MSIKRVLVSIVAMFIIAVVCVSTHTTAPFKGYAGSNTQFDNTDVLADLQASTLNGESFKITDFPYNTAKQASVINFVEYCYSFKANMRSNFGLYIYVYNPQGLNFNQSSNSNKLQLAVKYDASGNPIDYEKFNLKFCSKSSGAYDRLFYKFKVIDQVSSDGKMIVERVNSSERRYDVSGVELFEVGKYNAVEYGVNSTFKFSGFAQGYGADSSSPSSLSVVSEKLETVELDVKSTYYRTGTSNLGVDHQNQLNSVYFAVPNRFLEDYGKLQKIKAEWYEYRTKPIVVTSHLDFFLNAINNGLIGKYVEPHNRTLYYGLYYNKFYGSSSGKLNRFDWAFNPTDIGHIEAGYWNNVEYYLYYLFYNYDILTPVGGKDVADYIYSYSNNHVHDEKLSLKDNNVSAVLFESTVDTGRAKGYNVQDIDEADVDITKMLSYSSGGFSFWDKWNDFGFWNAINDKLPNEEYLNLAPIYAVKSSDIDSNNANTAKNLLINEGDVDEFKYYYDTQTAQDKTVFLFRFAVTDYFSGALDIHREADGFWDFGQTEWFGQAYMAQETIFLDFDIIQLTFNKDGVYRVIPVVASPIDIIGGITPPLDFDADKLGCNSDLLRLIALIAVLVLLMMFIGPIINIVTIVVSGVGTVFYVLFLPFKGIGKIIKRGERYD